MGLRRHIVASYASQGYVTLISIVMLPLYLRYLGAEAYGLVGFFAMLQAWFMLLDLGLTPTLARETARYYGKAITASQYGALVRLLELMFFGTAVLGAVALVCGADYIAEHWLHVAAMPLADVRAALRVMGVVIALRWMCAIYKSIVNGAERIVWLSNFNAAIATLRFAGALLVLALVAPTAEAFFAFQLAVALLELAVLAGYARRLLPEDGRRQPFRASIDAGRPLLKFSLSIAFTASVWIFVTQTDKLILSKILPLAEYGYFTIAVLVAGGVSVISGPVSSALTPRMARLEAEGDQLALTHVYRRSTQLVVVAATAAALTLALGAEPLLLAWTGNPVLALQASRVLALYALGNGILAVSAFPYYLQYAKGDLRLHLIGNALFVALLIPAIVYAARIHGARGAGYVWLSMNALYLLGWAPLVHRRLAAGLNRAWFGRDILCVAAPMGAIGLAIAPLLSVHDSRWVSLSKIALLFFAMAALGALCTSTGLAQLKSKWRSLIPTPSPKQRTNGG